MYFLSHLIECQILFSHFPERETLFRSRSKLNETNIYISEDFCPRSVDVPCNHTEATREARKNGKRAFLSYRTPLVRDVDGSTGRERKADGGGSRRLLTLKVATNILFTTRFPLAHCYKDYHHRCHDYDQRYCPHHPHHRTYYFFRHKHDVGRSRLFITIKEQQWHRSGRIIAPSMNQRPFHKKAVGKEAHHLLLL